MGQQEFFRNGDEGEFFRLVLDHVSDCFIAVDCDGLVRFINRPYCQLLGGPPERFIGRPVTDIVSNESQLPKVARGEVPMFIGPLTVRGHSLVTKQVPVKRDGEIVGAVGMALFMDRDQVLRFAKRFAARDLSMPSQRRQMQRLYNSDDIFGTCPSISKLRQTISRIAPARSPILIQGETGVGKELVAQAIHSASPRAQDPFIAVNCATIPDELIEAELFGYEGGAFTGARSSGSRGKFEAAASGTIFLDEIGDMPLHLQSALLRVLQEGEIVRVGGVHPIGMHARVVCATHHNLRERVARGLFREDLYFRIAVLEVDVPPLRARTDTGELAQHIVNKICDEFGRPRVQLSKRALEQISGYAWPGNVRELRNASERAIVMLDANAKILNELPILEIPLTRHIGSRPGHRARVDIRARSDIAQRQAIKEAIAASAGNLSRAAALLGINRATIYKKIKKFGIKIGSADRAFANESSSI